MSGPAGTTPGPWISAWFDVLLPGFLIGAALAHASLVPNLTRQLRVHRAELALGWDDDGLLRPAIATLAYLYVAGIACLALAVYLLARAQA